MNREIKFRAWQKHYKYMFTPDYIDFVNNDIIIGENDGDNRYENIPLMQYTGLKDKNGKEIYEIDIVEICVFFVSPENTDNDIHFKGIIIYENFKLSLKIYKYMNDLKGWKNIDVDCFPFDLDYKEKDNTYIIPIYDLCSISGNLRIIQEENIEVIGNIYENSYLLK